jgi:RNA polymerase sigma-70 factor (ECF subfamily)
LALAQAEFNRLVAEHGATLYRMAYRMIGKRHEAEDVVQDTYRSAWKSRELFESGRGERAWLVAILRRRVADHWRRHQPTVPLADPVPPEVGQAPDDPLKNDYSDEMQRALAQLPPELRETLLLVVVGELTHQEVADLQGIPLGTVLSRVSRARKRLREYLLAAGSQR